MDGFRREGNALIWRMSNETLRLEPWGQDSLRVRATETSAIRDDLPGALLVQASNGAEIEIDGSRGIIRNGLIAAEINAQSGHTGARVPSRAALRFFRSDTGEELLAEIPSYFPRPEARQFDPAGGDLSHLQVRFKAYEGERIYGLGQHQHGRLDQKGLVIDQLQYNSEVCIPFLLSSRGYGFLWHNPAVGRVELGADQTRWVAEATPQMDYWITAGDTPADILARYADATGHAPAFPEWAAGFWQCKLRYRTQEELLAVAREHKRRGLPMSVIVSDFFHWSMQGDWRFDPETWPDPAAMVRELGEMGIRLMVSVWPTVNPNSENYQEMARRGLLIRTEHGVAVHMDFMDTEPEGVVYVSYYDATHPEARQYIWDRLRENYYNLGIKVWFWDRLRENYYDLGIKVWWLDACEPEIRPRDPGNLRLHTGNGLSSINIYPMHHERGVFEGMRSVGEEEIITLCRSGWAGSQRWGACLWSGDIQSSFEALQVQVRAGLNVGLSGIPWWTTDIGGFFGGDITTPYFRELVVRWFQYGAFCPVFRLHGFRLPNADVGLSGGPNEVWSFGNQAYEIIRDLLFLRERLRPYIMAQMRVAQERGAPPMRPLFFDFPEDEGCSGIDDEFMFGPDLLVAPVLHEGATSRKVYLPGGAVWRDPWDDAVYDGGQSIVAPAPLDRIPLYMRGDAKLPILP